MRDMRSQIGNCIKTNLIADSHIIRDQSCWMYIDSISCACKLNRVESSSNCDQGSLKFIYVCLVASFQFIMSNALFADTLEWSSYMFYAAAFKQDKIGSVCFDICRMIVTSCAHGMLWWDQIMSQILLFHFCHYITFACSLIVLWHHWYWYSFMQLSRA